MVNELFFISSSDSSLLLKHNCFWYVCFVSAVLLNSFNIFNSFFLCGVFRVLLFIGIWVNGVNQLSLSDLAKIAQLADSW